MLKPISQDSFATLLLCTYVKPQEKIVNDYKPFTQKEWIKLSTKIAKSDIARPSNLYNKSITELIEELRINTYEANRIITLLSRSTSMALEVEKFASMGIWIITRADEQYPKRFKKVLKGMSPNILYGAGDVDILASESIGIVGSRNADVNSIEFTKKLSELAVFEDFTVISGGSKGIDSVAHNSAIDSGGKTIAVLSDGLSKFIKNKDNLNCLLNKQLVVISPYHPNSRFYSYTALERNKYIYGLSKLTVATASDFKKGGTWSGATENIKNNWVPMYVRQDDSSMGLLELAKLGAKTLSLHNFKETTIRGLLKNEAVANEFKMVNDSSDKRSEIYTLVWPLIEKHLRKPINVKKLSDILEVEEGQLNIWINIARREGKVKFIDADIVVASVFYNAEIDQSEQINMFKL